MIIRKYQPSDCKEITELFYHTRKVTYDSNNAGVEWEREI